MSARIEDYAMIGNRETAALVGRNGAIDWLCMPRFDSAACFAALLGDERHGTWQFCPDEQVTQTTRRYRGATMILETTFETANGAVMLTDFMIRGEDHSYVLRRISGLRGRVRMHGALVIRFDYGKTMPWASRLEDGRTQYVAGPSRLVLEGPLPFTGEGMKHTLAFEIGEGETKDFALGWSLSYRPAPAPRDVAGELAGCETRWEEWAARFSGAAPYDDDVLRSLLTLRALTHYETGGIVAAATTSLPEQCGGARNWDYRYCWLRDATLTLYALLESGFSEEALHWRRWLARAIAGSPAQLQIMYGIAGERPLDEIELDNLPGYETSRPVRIGNAASGQLQLDIYGEVMDALHFARRKGLPEDDQIWDIQCEMLSHLAQIWDQPDDGIWEMRGQQRHFVHSKVMAWVAFDRAIRSAEEFHHKAPLDEWRAHAARIHAEVCAKGFDSGRNSFVQYYGADALDASLLMIALTGFLPADDPRIAGTVRAIEEELMEDGFLLRYRTGGGADGLEGGEGVFLACSFWLVDNYVLLGRTEDARLLFERLLTLRNDVGLLSEEYDPKARRQLGNFPQAFSHIALINTAYNLARSAGPAAERADGKARAA